MRFIPRTLFRLFGFAANKCDRTESDIAMLRFTHSCPNNCRFCIDHETPTYKEIHDGKILACVALACPKKIIAITGGEPFLNPQKLKDFVQCVYGKKKMYINTSFPETASKNMDIVEYVFDRMDNIDISFHGHNEEQDRETLGNDYHLNKTAIVSKLAKKYADKMYLSCVLDRRYFSSIEDIRRRIEKFRKFGVKKFYFNEIANLDRIPDENYISINEIFEKAGFKKLKNPFEYGCHADISKIFKDLDVEVHVKRQCYKHGGTDAPGRAARIKEWIKFHFLKDAMDDELYIYENGMCSKDRKYKD